MLPFNPQGQARFSYQADFSQEDFANLSFFDPEKREILFHLSLRASEGLAVCNRRGADPEAWRRERRKRVRLDRTARVDILFAPPLVTVRLDGAEIFRFGKEMLRPPYPGLDRIGFVDFQGGLIPASVDIDIRDAGADPRLVLTQRLELRGTLPATAPRALEIAARGLEAPLPVIAMAEAGELRLRAMLPGRAWEGVAEGAPLHLTLRETGTETALAELTVTRDDIARHATALLRGGDLGGDPLAASQMIEHLRFAGLAGALPAPIRARLADVAAQFGLESFLWPAGAEADAATPASGVTALPDPDPDFTALAAAQAQLAQALRAAGPEADPVPLLDAATAELPERMKWDFYVSMADWFCLHDRFETLFAHARAAGTGAFRPSDNGWFNSGVLPFLLRQGDIAELREVTWWLVEDTESWIQTASLGWVMQRALADPLLDERDRDDLLYAFTDFIDRRRGDYWGRSPCRALIGAALELVAEYERLADYTRAHIDWFIPRAYGLTRQFWEEVAARGLSLSPQIEAARRSWAAVEDRIAGRETGDDAPLRAALGFFERVGCADTMRYRRELLGPSGLTAHDGSPPSHLDLVQAGMDPGEAAIRQLAFPGARPGGEDLARAAARAMPAFYDKVPRAPLYTVQLRASRAAADLLDQALTSGSEPDSDAIETILADLGALSTARSGYVGFTIGLGLMQGLLRLDRPGAARALRAGLQAMRRRLNDWERRYLPQSPALTSGLTGLRPWAESHAEARKILASFPRASRSLPAPAEAPLPGGDAATSALFDTLVVVFSCKPNLDTRIPAMRAGWLGRLAELGVPYIIVTGDGDGRRQGDVVHLDAPDDYEGLPAKTLAMIDWVHRHSSHAHLLKIDDDCFLNPDEFFHSQSHRKFDYYGRVLTRVPGQLDRAWHCAKSSSARGRLELDKSPEPSSYCDGGSGYTLSRRAMEAALEAAASPEGRALIRVSFMEDKLLGDLLVSRGIWPEGEDYRITVRRRENPKGLPVPRWLNGFDASRAAPVKLVHLDTHTTQAAALTQLDSPGLAPSKIWPSYQDVALVENSNALEMITPAERLGAARAAPVSVVACMRNEMFMLPRFLDHYRAQGVESFLIADNCSDDGTLEYLAEQPDVALFSVDTAYSLSHYGVAWQQALMAAFRMDRWSLVADADELLVWEPTRRASLPDLLAGPDFAEAEAARIFMLDMYPEGSLSEADFKEASPFEQAGFVDRAPFLTSSTGHGPFSDQPTWTSALRHRLIPGSRAELFVAQKLALLRYRPWMRLSAGLHYVADAKLAPRELLFAHFKYNADFRRKAMAEVARRQHFNDAEEYRKYLALASEGRDRVFDPGISVPWEACAFVRARIRG